jgi:hypothetical protein
VNKATENLIERLRTTIIQEREKAVQQIINIVAKGDVDSANDWYDRYTTGNHYIRIRRPHKIRVATMSAALDYLAAHLPAGIVKIDKRVTWQNNGKMDYFAAVQISLPPFHEFAGEQGVVAVIRRVMEKRDQVSDAHESMHQAYEKMVEVGKQTVSHYRLYAMKLRQDEQDEQDKAHRRRIQSLVSQLDRDLRHTRINSNGEDWGYFSESANNLYFMLASPVDEQAGRLTRAISDVIASKRLVSSLQDAAGKAMDAADEIEQKYRQHGTLAVA